MQRPAIVAVLGVDGSGKSTQTKLLAEGLRRDGTRAAFYRNPGGRPALNAVAHRFGRADGPDLIGERAVVTMETVIRWAAIARALLLAGLTRRVAVMDRYGYCQYAIMRARGDRGEHLVRGLFGVFPSPDVVVLLQTPPQVAADRVELRGKDHEDTAYLAALERAYLELPESSRFVVVDATGPIVSVQRQLRTVVDAALAAR